MELRTYIILILTISTITTSTLSAQYYFTKSGYISFFSEAPLENIAAHNNKATSVLDVGTGKLEFAVLIRAFKFEKALMQEHFNTDFMESAKYPKATFNGKITNIESLNFKQDGTYDVTVTGELTIHGITQQVSTDARFIIENGNISSEAVFQVKLADYSIEIPTVVVDNIAEVVEVTIKADYKILNR